MSKNINRLRARRFLDGVSQHQLAHDSGVNQSRISLFENDLIDLSVREKEMIAKALDLPEDELFN